MNRKVFHYYPVNITNSYSGKQVKGFRFPVDGRAYSEASEADRENLQQMQIYFGVNSVIASLNDLMRVGNDKTNKLYTPFLKELKNDYNTQCIAVLTLASSMCWVARILEALSILISLLLTMPYTKLNLLEKAWCLLFKGKWI